MPAPRASALIAVTTLAVAGAGPAAPAIAAPLVLVETMNVGPSQSAFARSGVLNPGETYTITVSGERHLPSNGCEGSSCDRPYGTQDAVYCYGSQFGADQFGKTCGHLGRPPKAGNPGIRFAAGPDGHTRPVPPVGIDAFGGGMLGSIPYHEDHGYTGTFTTRQGIADQHLTAGNSDCPMCTGGFTVGIFTEAKGQAVRFAFRQRNVVGGVKYTSSGSGTFRLDRRVARRDAGNTVRGGSDAPVRVNATAGTHHFVLSAIDRRVAYRFRVVRRAVYEALAMQVVVDQSDNPACPVGATGRLGLTEARHGRAKVTLRLACEVHKSLVFTRHRKRDLVRVRISRTREAA